MKPITVQELIEQLKKQDPAAPVVLALDEKGSDFGILYRIEIDPNGTVILWPAESTVIAE